MKAYTDQPYLHDHLPNIVLVPFCCQNSPDPSRHGALKVCCGIWHQDVSSRSFKSCKLQGGASMDQTCLSSTSHRCMIGLRSGEFGGKVNTSPLVVVLLKPFLNHFCFVAQRIILLSQQNITQSITLPLLAFLLPTVHPGTMCSPGKRRTCTRPSK